MYQIDLVYLLMLWGAPALAIGFALCGLFIKISGFKIASVVTPLILGLLQMMVAHMANAAGTPDSDIADLIGVQGTILLFVALFALGFHIALTAAKVKALRSPFVTE